MKKIILLASILLSPLASAREILSLEECLQMGESNNPYIRNARLDIISSKAMKDELTWEYFPTVSLNAIGYYARNPLLNIRPTDILGTSDFAWYLNNAYLDFANGNGLKTSYSTLKNGYSLAMMLTQPIYAGGRIVNGNRLAAIGIESSQLQADMKIRDIREEVEGKYWMVVALQEKMTTLEKTGNVLDSLQKFVTAACDAGLVAQSEQTAIKQKISQLRAGRFKLQGGLKLAKMDLFNAIGLKCGYFQLDDYLLSGELEEFESLEAIAAQGDAPPIESRLLEIQEKAKRLEKKVSVGELLPQVGVGLSYGYSDIQGRNRGEFNGIGFVSVKIPLTGIGKAASRARRMDNEIRKVGNEKEYLDEQLQLQKQQLFLAIETAYLQAGVSREARDDAQRQMQRCEADYKAGRSTLADLLQAELQYRTAAGQYIDDCIEYRKAVNTYKRRYAGGCRAEN